MLLTWESGAVERFPEFAVSAGVIKNVRVERTNPKTEELRKSVFDEVRSTFDLEELKDNPVVRAYRDLFWSLDVDPTKTRPSGEALLRRVLHGQDTPRISSAVDAYNLASLQTIVPISGFDLDTLIPPLNIRFSKKDDVFQGIGMEAPQPLTEKLLVVTDKKQVLCIYPHKDADATKITNKTENVLLVGYGAQNVSNSLLVEAIDLALSYVNQTSGGKTEGIEVFSTD